MMAFRACTAYRRKFQGVPVLVGTKRPISFNSTHFNRQLLNLTSILADLYYALFWGV